MGKGRKVIACRVSQEMLDEIRLTIARRNAWTKNVAWKEADFLKEAIRQLIRKMSASGKRPIPPVCRPAGVSQKTIRFPRSGV